LIANGSSDNFVELYFCGQQQRGGESTFVAKIGQLVSRGLTTFTKIEKPCIHDFLMKCVRSAPLVDIRRPL
jgi:hypothetical protein